MIKITQLTKTYKGGVRALRGIDLEIETGMFGLLGPNGAGKTTLMRILAGLLQPSSGSATILGHEVTAHHSKQAAKALLGYLPQELGLYPNLTGREFLDYIATLKGITNAQERQHQIAELLERVRLSDVANRQIKTYSGGMKRRVGVAQALLGDPKLVIVDEPTAGLDPEERVRLRNLLSEVATRCAVVLSTHIVEDISHSCNHIAVIRKGQVLFRGSPNDLIARSRGYVWAVMTNNGQPGGDVSIVSSRQLKDGVQYRVVGQPAPEHDPQPLEPSLEDGYIWLMRETQAAI